MSRAPASASGRPPRAFYAEFRVGATADATRHPALRHRHEIFPTHVPKGSGTLHFIFRPVLATAESAPGGRTCECDTLDNTGVEVGTCGHPHPRKCILCA